MPDAVAASLTEPQALEMVGAACKKHYPSPGEQLRPMRDTGDDCPERRLSIAGCGSDHFEGLRWIPGPVDPVPILETPCRRLVTSPAAALHTHSRGLHDLAKIAEGEVEVRRVDGGDWRLFVIRPGATVYYGVDHDLDFLVGAAGKALRAASC